MQPVSLVMFLVFGIFMFITLLLQVPTLFLGLILAPILSRSSWYVQFLYPWDIARWAHFFLIKSVLRRKGGKPDDKNRGFHSRTIEQRFEVVPGRVYIHPIPQFLDNLGWLVVSLPPPPRAEKKGQAQITVIDKKESIVAFLIDCGELDTTVKAIEMIQQFHYSKQKIRIQSILSTHKHHDHTGGNKDFMSHEMGRDIKRVYAGAVERVPQKTDDLVDGDKVLLPVSGSNDMNALISVEAIAVPSHTRGSLVFRLTAKGNEEQAEYLFTGDTMFSGGGGVPFEADSGNETEQQVNKSNGNTFIRATRGHSATERQFAEILFRTLPGKSGMDPTMNERALVFPGHEYTSELLSRQFQSTVSEACRWKNFNPQDFFQTVSNMYVALHRRTLPHNSGKLLAVPSTLKRELRISPIFRSLRKAGELVVRALLFWNEHFSKKQVTTALSSTKTKAKSKNNSLSPGDKTQSTLKKWTIAADEVQDDVFTTIYTKDLDSIVEGLLSGDISKKEAADRLQAATARLDMPVVNRRAIPGFLPSDKNIYRGILGIVTLGSKPAAMTISDSRAMKLPSPIDSNSDFTLVSRKRLLRVLSRLGLLENNEIDIPKIIKHLWAEAREVGDDKTTYGNNDLEASNGSDEVELGVLKWTLYGVPANQPSWLSKLFCMPCSSVSTPPVFPEHPSCKLQKKGGDLVSHDILTCPLCRSAAGSLEFKKAKIEERVESFETSVQSYIDEESDFNEAGEEVGLEIVGLPP